MFIEEVLIDMVYSIRKTQEKSAACFEAARPTSFVGYEKRKRTESTQEENKVLVVPAVI